MTGESKEAGLKTLMMTHHLRRKAAGRRFFQQEPPPPPNDTSLKRISASRGIVLSPTLPSKSPRRAFALAPPPPFSVS